MTSTPPIISTPRRRGQQFSLRTLAVLTILAGIGATWLALTMQKARKQREASEGWPN